MTTFQNCSIIYSSKEQGKVLKTGKGKSMKKSTLTAMYNYLNNVDVEINMEELRREVTEEYMRVTEKARTNRQKYEGVHRAVISFLKDNVGPKNENEIYEGIAEDLPVDFSVSKLRYGLLHYWTDEVTVNQNGRNLNTYELKAV